MTSRLFWWWWLFLKILKQVWQPKHFIDTAVINSDLYNDHQNSDSQWRRVIFPSDLYVWECAVWEQWRARGANGNDGVPGLPLPPANKELRCQLLISTTDGVSAYNSIIDDYYQVALTNIICSCHEHCGVALRRLTAYGIVQSWGRVCGEYK